MHGRRSTWRCARLSLLHGSSLRTCKFAKTSGGRIVFKLHHADQASLALAADAVSARCCCFCFFCSDPFAENLFYFFGGGGIPLPSTFSSLVKALRQSFKKKQAKQMQRKFHRYEKQEPTKHAFLRKKKDQTKLPGFQTTGTAGS